MIDFRRFLNKDPELSIKSKNILDKAIDQTFFS